MRAPGQLLRKMCAKNSAKSRLSISTKGPTQKRLRYLFVVGKRLALSRQRVGPVLSHGPLLRWHGFHQDSIDPRGRAHRQYIPMIRGVSPKFIRWTGGHESEESPWWRGVDPDEEEEVEEVTGALLLSACLCLWAVWSERCGFAPPRLPLIL